MTTYLLLKYLHVMGAAVLLGTGAGIAFFMLRAHQTGNAATIAAVARMVVLADFLFTTTAVVLQPVTGVLLAWEAGYSLWEGWIVLSIALYYFIGLFWVPVVFIQIGLRKFAEEAVAKAQPLPHMYHIWFWTWFSFGFPAFGAMLAIYWLMIARPQVEFWW